jgi:integrase
MGQRRQPKTPKGTVAIGAQRGVLFLRWLYVDNAGDPKRYQIFLRMPDTKINRQVAQLGATAIENDIRALHFDFSLERYKPLGAKAKVAAKLTVVELFERFLDYKSKSFTPKGKSINPSTLGKYKGTIPILKKYFGSSSVNAVDSQEAERFVSWFQSYPLAPRVRRERVELLIACWNWAITNGLVSVNPWVGLHLRIEIPKKQPRPFTQREMGRIIQAFREHPRYSYYADLVLWQFSSGMRPNETFALKLKHFQDGTVWVGSGYVRGKFGPTKTGHARIIPLNPQLLSLIERRRELAKGVSEDSVDEQLVFTGLRGGPIAESHLRKAWKEILKSLSIPHRRFYLTRATFVTLALQKGLIPLEVSAVTGHTLDVLYGSYAARAINRPLVNVFEDEE